MYTHNTHMWNLTPESSGNMSASSYLFRSVSRPIRLRIMIIMSHWLQPHNTTNLLKYPSVSWQQPFKIVWVFQHWRRKHHRPSFPQPQCGVRGNHRSGPLYPQVLSPDPTSAQQGLIKIFGEWISKKIFMSENQTHAVSFKNSASRLEFEIQGSSRAEECYALYYWEKVSCYRVTHTLVFISCFRIEWIQKPDQERGR